MKKRWIFAAVALFTVFAMVGCPTDSDDPAPTYPPTTVAVTGVTVAPTTLTIGVGETSAALVATVAPANATNKNVTWSTSDATKATVSGGAVTGVAVGTATITVTTVDGSKTATCAVTVVAAVPVTAVALNKNTLDLTVGGTETLTVSYTPNDATNKSVTWASSTPAVATVSSSGLVTAVSAGTATITATWAGSTVGNEVKDECTVTVTAGGGPTPDTVTISFFALDSDTTPLHTYTIEEGTSLEDAGETALPGGPTRAGYEFHQWQLGGVEFKLDTVVSVPARVIADWWTTTLTADGALEKVWLSNSGNAIYGFDLSAQTTVVAAKTALAAAQAALEEALEDSTETDPETDPAVIAAREDVADAEAAVTDAAIAIIKGIKNVKASFKVSEAVKNRSGIGPRVRLYGPYFFSPTLITNGDTKLYGDFALDANGAYIAKFDSSDATTIAQFNKFHPYFLDNSGPTNYDGFTADTWFDRTYPNGGYEGNPHSAGSPNSITKVIDAVLSANSANAVLPADTDYTKVYFAIGISQQPNNPHDAANGHNATEFRHGTTSLVKDVKIVLSDDTDVAGGVPAFPVVDGTGTTSQVFSGYMYNVQYSWRGAAADPVAIPKDPAYTPPLNPPAVPATADWTVDLSTLATQNPLTNADAFTGAYQGQTGPWVITFPSGLDVRSYSKYTIRAEAYGADGTTPIVDIGSSNGAGYGIGMVKFLYADVGWAEIATQYNLSCGDSDNDGIPDGQTFEAAFPGPVLDAEVARGIKIALQCTDGTIKFLKLIEMKFIK